jgi:hypothetical protein
LQLLIGHPRVVGRLQNFRFRSLHPFRFAHTGITVSG